MKTKIRKLTKRIIAFVMTMVLFLGAMPPVYVKAGTEFKWLGKDGKARVETGFGDGSNTEGIWYVVDDHGDGGESKVELDEPHGDDAYYPVTDAHVQTYKGIKGTAILNKGMLDYSPMVSLCFNLVDDEATQVNASAWGGLSISYESDYDLYLQLGLGPHDDPKIGYAYPQYCLPNTHGETKVESIAWSKFAQPGWAKGDSRITTDEAVEKLATVRILIQGSNGEYHFKINGIGSYNVNLSPEDPSSYIVTFNTNGGSAVADQTVAIGDKAVKPADPTRTGFTFAGWYADSALTEPFDFNTVIQASTTIYAKWIEGDAPTVYTVSFETNGGSAVAAQIIASGGKAAKPADPTKSGSTFGGWYSDSALTTAFSFDTPITADTVIYAKWNPVKTSVTLSSNRLTLRMGESVKLEAKVTPEDAADKSLSWTSSNTEAAKVDADGTVTALKSGETTITATCNSGGEKAECKVTVERKSVGDNEFTTRISDMDIDKYVVPSSKTVSVNFTAKLSKTETAEGTVVFNYLDAISYTGKKISPDMLKPADAELISLAGVLKAAGIRETVKAEDVLNVKYTSSKNKDAGEAKFYARLSVKKVAKNYLNKDEISKLKKVVAAANKELKKKDKRIKYTINPASLADMSSIELVAKTNKDGSFSIKDGSLKKIKALRVKFKATDEKSVKVSGKLYFTSNAKEDGTVKINGKKNFTGCVTVKATAQ